MDFQLRSGFGAIAGKKLPDGEFVGFVGTQGRSACQSAGQKKQEWESVREFHGLAEKMRVATDLPPKSMDESVGFSSHALSFPIPCPGSLDDRLAGFCRSGFDSSGFERVRLGLDTTRSEDVSG
jgi:hypothetical protein